MAKPTNSDRINTLEKKYSSLEGKIDKMIDLITSSNKVIDEPVFEHSNIPQTVKSVSGAAPPMTTEEASAPAKPEPLLKGKVPMDRYGNITDKSWKRVKCDDGSEKYIKFKVISVRDNGELELSEDVEDETETFYVDRNREKLAEWRKKRKSHEHQIALTKKFQTS